MNAKKIKEKIKNICYKYNINLSLSLVITFIGLVITFIGLFVSISQTGNLKNLIDTTKIIMSSVSTRYIGMFPDVIDDINDLLEKADKNIVIFEDVLGYGIYSDPERFHRTLTILDEKAEQRVEIHFVIYNNKLLKITRQAQHIGYNDIEKQRNYRKSYFIIGDSIYQKSPEKLRNDIFSADSLRDSILRKNIKEKKNTFDTFMDYSFGKRDSGRGLNEYASLDNIKNKLHKNISRI